MTLMFTCTVITLTFTGTKRRYMFQNFVYFEMSLFLKFYKSSLITLPRNERVTLLL